MNNICPHCNVDLTGPEIPREHLEKGYYGIWDGVSKRYGSRVIGHVDNGTYDGILFWACPDCGGRWHRHEEGSYLRDRAEPFVNPKHFDAYA